MVKVTHSAGHALCTPGKQSPDGFKEWSYTNEIVRLVMAELEQYEGVQQKRIDDPTGKTDYPLTVRSNIVNSFKPDLHIDYHLNGRGSGAEWTSGEGIETFVIKLSDKESVVIGEKVQNGLVQSLGFKNRGLKECNLHMLREVKARAKILIEFAFMTNKNEAMKMRTSEYQKRATMVVVEAIVAHYNLKKKVIPVRSKYTDKVTVPNTAFWQAELLVQEYQKRGYKCYATPAKPYVTQDRNAPAPFVVETDYQHANLVLIELMKKGYSRAVWETI